MPLPGTRFRARIRIKRNTNFLFDDSSLELNVVVFRIDSFAIGAIFHPFADDAFDTAMFRGATAVVQDFAIFAASRFADELEGLGHVVIPRGDHQAGRKWNVFRLAGEFAANII